MTRARQVAWTAAAVAGLVGLVVAVKPALWVSSFTTDPGVTVLLGLSAALSIRVTRWGK